jgi:hypothetical protein
MNMNRLLTLLFVGISGSLFGQGTLTDNFDKLICKEWVLKFYQQGSDKFPPSPEQKNDRMTFYSDHKVKSIEGGGIQNGVWEYNASKKLLTVTDHDTKEKMNLTVISLTETSCILEFTDPDGGKMKMHMAPVKN